jgi:hypothetical protein
VFYNFFLIKALLLLEKHRNMNHITPSKPVETEQNSIVAKTPESAKKRKRSPLTTPIKRFCRGEKMM